MVSRWYGPADPDCNCDCNQACDLFSDDFTGSDGANPASDWTETAGDWEIQSNELTTADDSAELDLTYNDDEKADVVEFAFKSACGSTVGVGEFDGASVEVELRLSDGSSGYGTCYEEGDATPSLVRMRVGSVVLDEFPCDAIPDDWNTLTVCWTRSAADSDETTSRYCFHVSVNGTEIFKRHYGELAADGSESMFPSASSGLRTETLAGDAFFDDFRVMKQGGILADESGNCPSCDGDCDTTNKGCFVCPDGRVDRYRFELEVDGFWYHQVVHQDGATSWTGSIIGDSAYGDTADDRVLCELTREYDVSALRDRCSPHTDCNTWVYLNILDFGDSFPERSSYATGWPYDELTLDANYPIDGVYCAAQFFTHGTRIDMTMQVLPVMGDPASVRYFLTISFSIRGFKITPTGFHSEVVQRALTVTYDKTVGGYSGNCRGHHPLELDFVTTSGDATTSLLATGEDPLTGTTVPTFPSTITLIRQ